MVIVSCDLEFYFSLKDVTLHDLDAANARPQGGQESIDECKQWICWLRSTGIESIDEWCASTRIFVGDFNARKLLSQCWWSTFTKPCYGSAGGPQGQLGANEDFPAFPRFKGVVTGEDM
ncbi:uncharacterized protein DS421_11g330860 [Arachis hypogaea]|nr:uncharacterized protein DS421_11g330860 [Arachis hypogaea]